MISGINQTNTENTVECTRMQYDCLMTIVRYGSYFHVHNNSFRVNCARVGKCYVWLQFDGRVSREVKFDSMCDFIGLYSRALDVFLNNDYGICISYQNSQTPFRVTSIHRV